MLLLRAASLTGYVELAGTLKINPYRLVQAVGLPVACLREPDMKIPADAVRQLLEDSAEQAHEESFDYGSPSIACCRIWDRWLSSCEKAQPPGKRSRRCSNTFDCTTKR